VETLNKKYERKRISVLCFASLLMQILSVLAAVYFIILVSFFIPSMGRNAEAAGWLSSAGQYLVAFPLCAVMMSLVQADHMEKHRLGLKRTGKIFLICCFMMLLGTLIGMGVNLGISRLTGRVPEDVVENVLGGASLLYTVVAAGILAPVFEELIFRKMLLDRLNRLGDRPAMFVSALLFALVHGNLSQFFYAFLVGLVLAYVYLRTGRVIYTILMHMLLNLIFGVMTARVGMMNSTVFSIVWLVVEILLAVAGMLFLILERKNIRLLRGWVNLPGFRWGSVVFLNPGMLIMLAGCIAMITAQILFL